MLQTQDTEEAQGQYSVAESIQVLIPEVRRHARRRRLWRIILICAVVVGLILGTSLLRSPSGPRAGRTPPGTATKPTGGTGISNTIPTKGSPTLEIYAYTGSPSFSALFFSRPISAGSSRQFLVRGLQASVVPSAGPVTDIAVSSYNGGDTIVYQVGSRAAEFKYKTPATTVLLATASDLYVEDRNSGVIDEVNLRTSRVVAQYGVPSLPIRYPPGYTGLVTGNVAQGTIAALILDSGRLYALAFNTYSAAIVDLSTHTTRLLHGFGVLGGGVLAADGDIYVTASRVTSTTPFSILRIDPSTLDVVSTFHTGVRTRNIDNIEMQALHSGGVAAFVAQEGHVVPPVLPINDYLWKISSTGLVSHALPANLGLYMRAFGDNVYIFGGAGTNKVSRLNLVSMKVTRDVTRLATPKGTYVFALL
jgi:hypothetical protein